MSNSKTVEEKQQMPTATAPTATSSVYNAASAPYSDVYAMRAPPPTYEESQRMRSGANGQYQKHGAPPPPPSYPHPAPVQNQYYGMTHHQQLPAAVHVHGYNTQPTAQQLLQYAAVPPNATAAAASGIASNYRMQPHVIEFDSRAEIRTTASGAVIVPPPPPGCAPTPAQIAAGMQGQPVVIKQKKRSFF